ncbi:HAD hydrolase family protein [Nonomuraea sp. NPDC050227]|uniref:HAD hydrolase family protein n=1 Tax=Nonomuraea sp. NPDC050227 TaxID=3364360 RepID=UPI0037A021EA
MTTAAEQTRTLRFAAFDLDGTVLDRSGRFVAGLDAGLRRVRGSGLIPIIISGRSYQSFLLLALAANTIELWDHCVLLDEGDVVYDRANDNLHYRRVLPAHTVATLLGLGQSDLVVQWRGTHHASSARAAAAFAMAYELPRVGIRVGLPPESARPTRVTVFGTHSDLCTAVGSEVDVDVIRPFGATVLRPRSAGKAASLAAHLAAAFGEPDLTRVIAFGDGDSDASMLAACRIGVAVAGSSAAALAAASIQLDHDLPGFLANYDFTSAPTARKGGAR